MGASPGKFSGRIFVAQSPAGPLFALGCEGLSRELSFHLAHWDTGFTEEGAPQVFVQTREDGGYLLLCPTLGDLKTSYDHPMLVAGARAAHHR